VVLNVRYDLEAICGRFQAPGRWISGAPFGGGHIHDSYVIVCDRDGARTRYLLQRINQSVFHDPPAVMRNIQRVTEHIRAVWRCADVERRTLMVIPTHDGERFCRTADADCWRMFVYIENTHGYDIVDSPERAREAARAFGRFQSLLRDLPPPRLEETIPGFHDTARRYSAFEQAVEADSCNRAASARAEIEFALRHRPIVDVLPALQARGDLPERVVHNDTKINNVLFDDATGEALCVVDLDTVMPGLVLHDFGDMVRTVTSPATEDERDVSKVTFRKPFFEALTRGYLVSTAEWLTPAERSHLPFAGKLITYEQGLRFLTDYLSGDTYYPVQRPAHNLDRCRTQFALVESILPCEEWMSRTVESA